MEMLIRFSSCGFIEDLNSGDDKPLEVWLTQIVQAEILSPSLR
jgi:hypothetical protein